MQFFRPIIFLLLIGHSVTAQVLYPGDFTEDYYRILILKNSSLQPKPITIHPSIIHSFATDSIVKWNIWENGFHLDFQSKKKNNFTVLNPRIEYAYNLQYPRGYNNGPVWKGKGSNASFTGGIMGNVGILHFTFAPVFWYAQNNSFAIPSIGFDKNEFSYPVEDRIDWVMRYGNDEYHQFDLGQSEVRIILKNFTLGMSTANFSWGPSRYNPIIMSKNASGFPHIDLGTARPVRTKIGNVEFKWYWGAIFESDYFDDDPINDKRYITGFALGYQPKFVKGLTFGLNRIMYTRWADGDLSTVDFFNAFVRNTHKGLQKNDEYDQLVSMVLEYTIPQVGLNMYLEYARNDFFGSIMDMLEHPDRTRARTIGLTKVFDLDNGNLLEINYENTTLSSNQIQILLPGISATYYVHNVVENGYTHNGQIVGAGIGPGSNSDILWTNIYNPKGKLGFTIQRIRFNDDYLVSAFPNTEDEPTDYEITIGADYVRTFKNFSIHPTFLLNYRNNMLFRETEHDNFVFSLSISYLINK
jgi:hypothetical protein